MNSRGRGLRLGPAAAGLLLLLQARPVFSQTQPTNRDSPAEPAPTFAYTTTAEPRPLRAVLELGGIFALGFAWYATTSKDVVRNWDVNYSFETFRRKLTGDAFGPDTNAFGTNFIGHPLGGTGYYLSARSNRLGILPSFGFAVAGSLLWELFGEVSEVVSMNDMLVTPLGGLAIGEATLQLGAFFDRSSPTTGHRVLGTVFAPLKSLNDGLDGLEPARVERGFPSNEWHRFELLLSAGTVYEPRAGGAKGAFRPDVRGRASSLLIRLPGYDGAGRGSLAFTDGNISSLALDLAFSGTELSDLAFAADVVLAGEYFRGRGTGKAGARTGGNLAVGIASGFEYSLHDYSRGDDGPLDRIALIRPLCLAVVQRGALGELSVDTDLNVGGDFGGVRPFAPVGSDHAVGLPPVLDRHGYYFGAGGHANATVAVEHDGFEVRGELASLVLRAVGGPGEPAPPLLDDVRTRTSLRIAQRLRRSAAVLHLLGERRTRSGRALQARHEAEEFALTAGVGALF